MAPIPSAREMLAHLHDNLISGETDDIAGPEAPCTTLTLIGSLDDWEEWLINLCSGIGCTQNHNDDDDDDDDNGAIW